MVRNLLVLSWLGDTLYMETLAESFTEIGNNALWRGFNLTLQLCHWWVLWKKQCNSILRIHTFYMQVCQMWDTCTPNSQPSPSCANSIQTPHMLTWSHFKAYKRLLYMRIRPYFTATCKRIFHPIFSIFLLCTCFLSASFVYPSYFTQLCSSSYPTALPNICSFPSGPSFLLSLHPSLSHSFSLLVLCVSQERPRCTQRLAM